MARARLALSFAVLPARLIKAGRAPLACYYCLRCHVETFVAPYCSPYGDGDERGIRTLDRRRMKPMRYHCAISSLDAGAGLAPTTSSV